jgi:hypothetical protein
MGNILAASVGQVFGDNTSPPNFEPIARARCQLAEHYSATKATVPEFPEYLDDVQFELEPADGTATFAEAVPDRFNPGVVINGARVPAKFNMHVDDCLYVAANQAEMRLLMRYSIHALHQVLGGDDPATRPPLVDKEKFHRAPVGPKRIQLGDEIDTRQLRVSTPDEKRRRIYKDLTTTWGTHRRSFTILQAAKLLGTVYDVATICPWGMFLVIELQHTMKSLLMKNYNRVMQNGDFQQLIEATKSAPAKLRFFNKKVGRALWHNKSATFIGSDLRDELNFLTWTFSDNAPVKWSSPIANLIPRDPSYTTWGDASLEAGGGFSLVLKFWFTVDWPDTIKRRTIRHLKAKDQHLISINLLEYAVVILGLAASILAWNELPEQKPQHPLLLLFTDNTTAESWTRKISGLKSPQARGLARLFCHLLMFTPDFGIMTKHIDGEKNDVADFLTRLREKLGPNSRLDFTDIVQKYPQLSSCRRFRPSQELLSALYSTLSTGSAPMPTTRMPLGRLTREAITTLNFAKNSK